MKFGDMTDKQRLAWGKAEAALRNAEMQARLVEVRKAMQASAKARRKVIGATQRQATAMVTAALRAPR